MQHPRTEGADQAAHQPPPWPYDWHPWGDLPVPRAGCQPAAGDTSRLWEMPQGETINKLWETQVKRENYAEPKRVQCLLFLFVWGGVTAFRSFRPAQERLLNLPAAGWPPLCWPHRLRPRDRPFRSVHFSSFMTIICAWCVLMWHTAEEVNPDSTMLGQHCHMIFYTLMSGGKKQKNTWMHDCLQLWLIWS